MNTKVFNADTFKSMDQQHINLYKEHMITKYYNLMLSHKLLKYIDKLNGFQFEHFIAQICNLNLYTDCQVSLTPKSHDFGIDVLFYNSYKFKKGMKYTQIGFQCKHTKGNSIPSQCLGETLEGVDYYNLDYGIIITNGLFSSQTQKGYKQLNNPRLILMNRDKLLKFIKDVLIETNVQALDLKTGEEKLLYDFELSALKYAKRNKRKYDIQGHNISTLINNYILKNKSPLRI